MDVTYRDHGMKASGSVNKLSFHAHVIGWRSTQLQCRHPENTGNLEAGRCSAIHPGRSEAAHESVLPEKSGKFDLVGRHVYMDRCALRFDRTSLQQQPRRLGVCSKK